MTTEKIKKEMEEKMEEEVVIINKFPTVKKTCKTCNKRVRVQPSRVTCPICHTPFILRKKVVKAQEKAKKTLEKIEKEHQGISEISPDRLKKFPIPAGLTEKVKTFPEKIKSGDSRYIAKQLGVERKLVCRAMSAIRKGA